MKQESICEKIRNHVRLSIEDAAWLYEHATDAELAELATLVRSRFHTPDRATYLIMAIINYTNICVAKCDYCAFYRSPRHAEAYLLGQQELQRRITAARDLGCTLISFNGGFHPGLSISHYAELFASLRSSFPDLTFFEMTVAEFIFVCRLSKISYQEGARILKASGTQWITGGGAEVLSPSFRRRHSRRKFTVSEYYKAQRAVLDEGLGSTATMVIGFDESLEERFEHLSSLRDFQDACGNVLPSFLCWTYKPWNTAFGGSELDTRSYLRWLAICRIFLDNIPHIRTSVLTRNNDALLGLKYGADDFDLPTEDEVTEKAGATISHNFAAILDSASALGFKAEYRAPFTVRAPQPNFYQAFLPNKELGVALECETPGR